jgi:16S rRNA C967 or C1407 C5-methylase (RsmB/RsmF family)
MPVKAQAAEQGGWPPRTCSDEKVKAATGNGWMGWFVILNNMNANALPHKEVAKRLKDEHGAPSWWSQMIAVEYERARGGRKKNERAGGTFAVNVTKVMPVSLSELFSAATAAETRKAWFPPGVFEETSKTKGKYWRGKWKKDRKLEFGFYEKGDRKSQIAMEISKLPSEADIEKERAAWKKASERLSALVGDK